jgi:hypothetical protein
LPSSKYQRRSSSGVNKKAVQAYDRVSLRVAKMRKPHAVGETLLPPAAKDGQLRFETGSCKTT